MNKHKEYTQECMKIVKDAIKNKGKETINDICIKKGKGRNYVSTKVWTIRKKEENNEFLDTEEQQLIEFYDSYCDLNKEFKNKKKKSNIKENQEINYSGIDMKSDLTNEELEQIEYDAEHDEEYDERSVGEFIRESEEEIVIGNVKTRKISGYHYKILLRDKNPLEGFLTREEMELLCRLYSNIEGGAGLTIRAVSRHFRHLTYIDLKRILRAFNITKQSLPVAPHTVEEKTDEEVIELFNLGRVDNIQKKAELDRERNTEKQLREALIKLTNRDRFLEEMKEAINGLFQKELKPLNVKKFEIETQKTLIVYLSDLHIGAHTPEDSIYNNEYNERVLRERLEVVLSKIQEQFSIFGVFDAVSIINLGDSIDGFDRQTVRRHHELSQNMNNKEQYRVFVESMISFFETLHKMEIANNIEYYAATNDNHSGSAGYIANKTLDYVFRRQFPDMKVDIFEKFIQHFCRYNHAFVLTHGKDEKHRKNGFPLVLDKKTESYFEEYIRVYRINSKHISVCKGDLHQSSTTYGQRIRYKNIPSVYGSSDYIHTNYGNTPSAFEFEIISEDSDTILGSRVEFD